MALTNEVCTELNDLNDDCLLEICKQLNIIDLLTFREVSARFREIADISRSRRTLDLCSMGPNLKISQIEKAFQVYGHQIREVKFNNTPLVRPLTHILPLIVKYCKPGTMRRLTLVNGKFAELLKSSYASSTFSIYANKFIFQQLTTLVLHNCSVFIWEACWIGETCASLEKLKLSAVPTLNDHFQRILDSLKTNCLRKFSLSLDFRDRQLDRAPLLGDFLRKHNRLEHFEVKGLFAKLQVNMEIFRNFGCNLKVLDTDFRAFKDNFIPLVNLRNLQFLEVHVFVADVAKFSHFSDELAKRNTLKGLSVVISESGEDEDMEGGTEEFHKLFCLPSLKSFTNLRGLKIVSHCIPLAYQFEFAALLPNLNFFKFSYRNDFEAAVTYFLPAFHQLVTDARNLITIYIKGMCAELWNLDLFNAIADIRRSQRNEEVLTIYNELRTQSNKTHFVPETLQKTFKTASNFVKVVLI